MRLLLIALTVPLFAACGSSAEPEAKTSLTAPMSSVATDTSCAALVGKPVSTTASCGDFDAPGSAGCYPDGTQDGEFYYFIDAASVIAGRPGDAWRSLPADAGVSDMAAAIGC